MPPIIPTDPYKRYFIAHSDAGERGWEIGVLSSRDRVCADMTERTAKHIFYLLCHATEFHWRQGIPFEQIIAIWRLVEEQGGIPTDIKI